MKLLVIRHAIAEERADFARTGQDDDDLRPLTAAGRKKMRAGARGLAEVVPSLTTLVTSPLVRARQTAKIVSAAFDGIGAATLEELTPDHDPTALLPWLTAQADKATVAIVGHEPHLSLLASWLLTGQHRPVLRLKKGAACLLEFEDERAPGRATLLWAMTPAQLRTLGTTA